MGKIKLNNIPFAVAHEAVLAELNSDAFSGLTQQEVQKRIEELGLNTIEAKKNKSIWLILWGQFNSPIVGLLVIAASLSFYFQEWLDGVAILIVLLINTLIGFYMEYKAEKSMNALQKLSAIPAKTLRNKKLEEINAEEIVPGDVIFVEAGDMIPADGRIFTTNQLQVDESALTGESIPIEKQTEKIQADTTLAERYNMLYKGTFVTKGNAYMVTTVTGMDTELGNIAKMVHEAEQVATPLEKKLEAFSKRLIWLTGGLVILIFAVGLIKGQNFFTMLQTSIALAVAAIPEGLPIVATLALARGMMKMAKQKVIVKKLSAVETLGGTNIICSDKTGTLTQNKIEVNEIITVDNSTEAFEIILRIAVLCNTAVLHQSEDHTKEIGDPLEIGLLKFALKNNINSHKTRTQFPKIKGEPFSSETKIMATLHQDHDSLTIYSKGAAEEIIKHCTHRYAKNGLVVFDEQQKNDWIQKAEKLAREGLKVIGGAYKPLAHTEDVLIENLAFVGLFGLIDPPRKEVFEAIQECKNAGIKVIMITGDHPATAKNIALKLGIIEDENTPAMLGKDMKDYDVLTEKEKKVWANTTVFARVSPKQKLDLVTVLQENGNVIGMTGDGVNDAPALKKADIGIAMGLKGTQVSQEAADMVLKTDSFAAIVIAIKQGRIIFENIRKFVIFLLSCNLSELLIIATAAIFNFQFQLLALQILFINLVTDLLPALALGMIGGSDHIMKKPPRNMKEPIIDQKRWVTTFFYAIVIGASSLGAVLFSHYLAPASAKCNHEICNNILFFTLIFSQLLHVFNMGSGTSFFRSEVMRNKYVWGATAISLLTLLGAYAFEPSRKVLSMYEMNRYDWAISIGASFASLIIIQLGKKLKLVKQ